MPHPGVAGAANPDSTMGDGQSYMPLVFEGHVLPRYHGFPQGRHRATPGGLDDCAQWLREAQSKRERSKRTRYGIMIEHPEIVRYNAGSLPKPPKDVVKGSSPENRTLTVEHRKTPPTPPPAPADRREIKKHNWIHTFTSNVQFTQAYISNNWYQGGENSFNILADVNWECNLNQTLHPKWLFNNNMRYKLGISTAPGDSLRKYAISEDNFQFESQLGYKAVKHWYYSATLLFKTQFFKNYLSNTHNMTTCFLSPGELNIGIGMTYSHKDKNEYKVFIVSLAPLSYNLKVCRDIDNIDPTKFGIKAGRHTKHDFGLSLEGKMTWKITPSISWTSRLYAFTNYKYVQGDWENTFVFSATRHLNTQLYTHLRYDKSHPWDADWRFWQFKEILSLGLTYRFATS